METPNARELAIVDAWRSPEAATFFRNVWPMYVHELSGFDTDFYTLDPTGRWQPDLVEDWLSSITPPQNLRSPRDRDDPEQPFQRAHVVTCDQRPVGFVCLGMRPFRYMMADVELTVSEFFLVHAHRGTETAARVVQLVLQRYPGAWELSVIHDNAHALRFWRRVLPALHVRELVEAREPRDISFRFVAGAE